MWLHNLKQLGSDYHSAESKILGENVYSATVESDFYYSLFTIHAQDYYSQQLLKNQTVLCLLIGTV